MLDELEDEEPAGVVELIMTSEKREGVSFPLLLFIIYKIFLKSKNFFWSYNFVSH
jgi:hypothetical protein